MSEMGGNSSTHDKQEQKMNQESVSQGDKGNDDDYGVETINYENQKPSQDKEQPVKESKQSKDDKFSPEKKPEEAQKDVNAMQVEDNSEEKKIEEVEEEKKDQQLEVEAPQVVQYKLTGKYSVLLNGWLEVVVNKNDITSEKVDAITNAANEYLSHGAGVAGAIMRRGGYQIQVESDEWIKKNKGKCKTGQCAITGAGNMKKTNGMKYVIHAVGPIWSRGKEQDSMNKLQSCVFNTIKMANQYKCKSVALPAISSGIFGFPKPLCAEIMFETINWIAHNDKQFFHPQESMHLKLVKFTNFDDETTDIFQDEFRKRYPSQSTGNQAEPDADEQQEIIGGSQEVGENQPNNEIEADEKQDGARNDDQEQKMEGVEQELPKDSEVEKVEAQHQFSVEKENEIEQVKEVQSQQEDKDANEDSHMKEEDDAHVAEKKEEHPQEEIQ